MAVIWLQDRFLLFKLELKLKLIQLFISWAFLNERREVAATTVSTHSGPGDFSGLLMAPF